MPAATGSRRADNSALEALVDAAAGILAADSLSDTLTRIAHHLASLVDFDEISVYEVREEMLVPVFALGAYADEVMADSFPVTEGVTGWVVTHRRTRNVERADIEPLAAVVEGTENEPEALVSVPLQVGDRVVAALNVYRIGPDKEFSAAEVATVERFATMAALAFDSARQRDTLREQARTDGLTGLLNHRACHEALREELAGASRARRPLGVVVLDLDHFKSINDVYGHGEGDKVLKEVAARLRGSLRAGDAVARLGGEEFALILPGVDGDGAAEAAERARAAIADVQVSGAGLTCSAGVAAFPEDALVPLFQPVLELATGRVAGYEALARMPDGPFRPPDEWFNQAHRVGLGPALEAAALRAALRARNRPERTFLALNVSPGALVSHEVRAVLPQDLTGIVIELTEHELFSADLALDRELDALRTRGARIALDDAGNGYAGLQQIIRIAPDILKVDRSLVDGIHDDPHRFALLEALISFASTTRAAVCAEGVETLEDLAALAGMDVTYAQGWALARPDAPWAPLSPAAAAAASAGVRIGIRIGRGRP